MTIFNRVAAVCQKYENGASDRIVRPQRDGYDADRTQVNSLFILQGCKPSNLEFGI